MDDRLVDVVCADTDRRNCVIKLDGVYCDGYNENASVGAFSHFHSDHIRHIPKCVSRYDVLITHSITFNAIKALHPGMQHREQWVPQDYDTAYKLHGGGAVRLLKANHIPGSSQIHVEASDGTTMTYSGDFGYPDVQVRESEYLVLDSNHGDPGYDGRTDRKSVKNRMFEHIAERLETNPRVVVLAWSGTMQELVRHFEIGYGQRMGEDVSFVMDKKQRSILHSIYREDCREERIRHIIEHDSQEYWDLIMSGKKCVIFSTQRDPELLDNDLRGLYKVIIDRYRFEGEPIVATSNGCRFNLSAHASIEGIYDYIGSVRPKYVVTDNSRSRHAKQLAKMIRQKFDWVQTEHRPTRDMW